MISHWVTQSIYPIELLENLVIWLSLINNLSAHRISQLLVEEKFFTVFLFLLFELTNRQSLYI